MQPRKKYFVDRSVQGAIVRHLVMQWLLFVLAGGAFLYFVEIVIGDPRLAGRNVLNRHSPTILAVLALAPILICDLCKLTNRFAGPMVRLRRAMKDLAEGRDVDPVHFRDGDFWRDLDVDFNRVLQRLRKSEKSGEQITLPDVTAESNAMETSLHA